MVAHKPNVFVLAAPFTQAVPFALLLSFGSLYQFHVRLPVPLIQLCKARNNGLSGLGERGQRGDNFGLDFRDDWRVHHHGMIVRDRDRGLGKFCDLAREPAHVAQCFEQAPGNFFKDKWLSLRRCGVRART